MTSQWPAQYVGQAQDGEAQTKKLKYHSKTKLKSRPGPTSVEDLINASVQGNETTKLIVSTVAVKVQ